MRLLASVFFVFFFFITNALAQSSSPSYRLDYERNVSDAGYKQSASYNLIGAITSISAEGESGSYNLRNIYAGLGVTTICGDGIIEGSEQCEGTNFNGLTCASLGYNSGYLECVSCQIVSHCYNTSGGDSHMCGNGIKEAGEQCDDGNTVSGDGCSSGCRIEYADCGNGIVEIGEECDDGNINTGDGCTPDCKIEIIGPVCGNGIKESGEECDDGNLSDGDGCSSSCEIEVPAPVCGNGAKEEGEACDDGNLNNGDGCDSSCQFEFGFPIPVCGNGVLEMNEYCDDGNLSDGDGCSSSCEIEVPAPICGNGIKESGEECDDGNLNNGDGCSASCMNEDKSLEERLFYIFQPKPVTIFPPELHAVAPEVSYHDFHFNKNEYTGVITVLDETPFIVTQLTADAKYEIIIYGENGEEIIRQGVQADLNGIVKAESLPYLDYKYYEIKLFDKNHELAKEFKFVIEDRKYRLHEITKINDITDYETICLGIFPEDIRHMIEGKGKPKNEYFAYLQSSAPPILNKVNPITMIKVTADDIGNFKIPLPEFLEPGKYHADIVQVYDDGKVSRNKRYSFEIAKEWKNIWILIAIALVALIGKRKEIKNLSKQAYTRIIKPKNGFKVRMIMSILLALSFIANQSVFAAVTTPQVFIYEGKLLNPGNTPITTPQTFRFSLWNSKDLVAGDVDGAGAINGLAPAYSGWSEVQTVTPNVDGTFFFELGSVTPLPDMFIGIHDFLQVEIKPSGSPDTSYELMDPTGDNGADTDDRQTIGQSPFTDNADFIDNAELGTNAGDIAVLDIGGLWNINFIPGGTNADTFIIDYDDSVVAGDISLQFGNTIIGAILKFSVFNNWFEFSDDVSFNKHEIKNVAIDNQAGAPIAPVTGQIYHNTTDGNTYIWNGVIWEDITATAGADDLDTVYTTDADKIMNVNNIAGLEFESTVASDITFDLQSTGDLVVQASGSPFATFTDTGEVGIGNNTPASILHVDSNDANTAPILTLENTAGDMQIFRTDATPEGSITGSIGDFAIDGTNGMAYIKNSGNATNTGWVQFGGQRAKQMVFNVEYEDSVAVGDGTDNRGILTSKFIDTGARKYNFAEWTTTRALIQDVDIIYSIRLPEDFISFTATPLEIIYATSDADTAKNKIDVYLYDTTDTTVPLTGASALANGAWTSTNITFGGAPTFTAGDVITLIIKLSATNAGNAKVADVIFNYNGL